MTGIDLATGESFLVYTEQERRLICERLGLTSKPDAKLKPEVFIKEKPDPDVCMEAVRASCGKGKT